MKLKYLPPTFLPHHFVGFSREEIEEPVTKEEWDNTVAKVKDVAFPALHAKMKGVDAYGVRPCCSKIKDVGFVLDKTIVGVALCKIPDASEGICSKMHRQQLNEINLFAFYRIAVLADKPDRIPVLADKPGRIPVLVDKPGCEVFSKLCEEGVLVRPIARKG